MTIFGGPENWYTYHRQASVEPGSAIFYETACEVGISLIFFGPEPAYVSTCPVWD